MCDDTDDEIASKMDTQLQSLHQRCKMAVINDIKTSSDVLADIKKSRKILYLLSSASTTSSSVDNQMTTDIYYNLQKEKGTQAFIPVRIDDNINENYVPRDLMQIRHHNYEESDEFYQKLVEDIKSE